MIREQKRFQAGDAHRQGTARLATQAPPTSALARAGAAAAAGAVLLFALAAAPAHACYTGLVAIPTAEVLEPGTYGIELQYDDGFAHHTGDSRILNTELGFSPRLEAGVDFDLSPDADARALLNAKYLLATGGEGRTALGLGICDLGRGSTAAPYAVATRDFRSARGHLGVVRLDGYSRLFVGIDGPVSRRLTLMADYTAGSENSATIGGSYVFDERHSLLAGVVLPNSSGGDTEFTVHYVINGSLRRAGRDE